MHINPKQPVHFLKRYGGQYKIRMISPCGKLKHSELVTCAVYIKKIYG